VLLFQANRIGALPHIMEKLHILDIAVRVSSTVFAFWDKLKFTAE
jgi:hypothetical protein